MKTFIIKFHNSLKEPYAKNKELRIKINALLKTNLKILQENQKLKKENDDFRKKKNVF